jgi:hypothetical protein
MRLTDGVGRVAVPGAEVLDDGIEIRRGAEGEISGLVPSPSWNAGTLRSAPRRRSPQTRDASSA